MATKNPWIEHVKKTQKKYPELPLRDILKVAKRTYNK